jgi:acetyl esterase/lipase
MNIYSRFLLLLLVVLCSSMVTLDAQDQETPEKMALWAPSAIPDGPGPSGPLHSSASGSVTNISAPMLIVHRPLHPKGIGILVISGGGYAHEEQGHESGPAAAWLASQGITAFELIYRLPAEGWATANVPFEDGQRAIRIIRSRATQFQLRSDQIGVMGFSAGGHLAGMLITQPDFPWYPIADHTDEYSSRPDFAALLYPVITMLPPYNHTHSYRELLGNESSRKAQERYSVNLQVTSATPPVFLAQAKDDPVSPVQNSELMYQALRQVQVPVEMHLFTSGGHGWGMGQTGSSVSAWPSFFMQWLEKIKTDKL